VLLAKYNILEKTIYTHGYKKELFTKCWYEWENQIRIGISKYYHVRPKRKNLPDL